MIIDCGFKLDCYDDLGDKALAWKKQSKHDNVDRAADALLSYFKSKEIVGFSGNDGLMMVDHSTR
jgi:hypothetical protein